LFILFKSKFKVATCKRFDLFMPELPAEKLYLHPNIKPVDDVLLDYEKLIEYVLKDVVDMTLVYRFGEMPVA